MGSDRGLKEGRDMFQGAAFLHSGDVLHVQIEASCSLHGDPGTSRKAMKLLRIVHLLQEIL